MQSKNRQKQLRGSAVAAAAAEDQCIPSLSATEE